MIDKEVLKIIVEQKNNSLIASVYLDERDDVMGNFSFAFLLFCKSINLTTEEGLRYLKQNIELWKNGGLDNEHTKR